MGEGGESTGLSTYANIFYNTIDGLIVNGFWEGSAAEKAKSYEEAIKNSFSILSYTGSAPNNIIYKSNISTNSTNLHK